ncbi:unnamed protein product [Vitrella brassicaformis CCMP3155]|uniref:Uncharacterized protein n=1 Tax=Vitrella brassicaformis (strain CCMP3155) TaxID=1169540 RepID=A0A0G4F1U0_VITBC|nr:unnamed protein product [Vitrella brassicaformis CCMP3155]|mmetsp:Transcript_5900/g.14131  ORF Transcript_5900/g.14131 Transcript_5900/m.14131 type:complete len:298 (-) Transcript_5900:317-1210(-)|eukprot:CEM05581.1 unnamed protein product [Vitrella brassicaformis CCMP3155]
MSAFLLLLTLIPVVICEDLQRPHNVSITRSSNRSLFIASLADSHHYHDPSISVHWQSTVAISARHHRTTSCVTQHHQQADEREASSSGNSTVAHVAERHHHDAANNLCKGGMRCDATTANRTHHRQENDASGVTTAANLSIGDRNSTPEGRVGIWGKVLRAVGFGYRVVNATHSLRQAAMREGVSLLRNTTRDDRRNTSTPIESSAQKRPSATVLREHNHTHKWMLLLEGSVAASLVIASLIVCIYSSAVAAVFRERHDAARAAYNNAGPDSGQQHLIARQSMGTSVSTTTPRGSDS